ncbi:MAG TPA: D-glycerate dehydrogenase [Candidatus Paceibacterota bacterium]|jgi:glyoxylate reductase|nr:D-glycerate dehydrogenase [Candidatus Paceibacterota bacterium]
MTKTIFVTRPIPEAGLNMLRDKGYTVDIREKSSIPSQKEIVKALKKKQYDAVVTLLTDKIDTLIFDAAPTVKIYANYASGFDNVDLVDAEKKGIMITNAPAVSTSEAVAEHTFALMLSLAARIVEADEFVRRGKYTGWDPMNFIGTDILGKTLGLIGAGRIGGQVAHYAKAFGLKIIYSDVKRNDAIEQSSGAIYYASPEDVLKQADIISLHVPLLPSTKHLINGERLAMMKKTAFIVNTSRGPIIDELALVDALQNKVIAGAGLDVFEFEPTLIKGLAKLDNVILTPHIASASDHARNEMSQLVAQNIIDFFEGRIPVNKVN